MCVYPQIARYRGKGDPNSPESWACRNPWDGFDRDYRQLLRNISQAIKFGTLDNLPN